MIVECCSQERTYAKFYGLIGERLCKLNQIWSQAFDTGFRTYFDTIHRYDTNKLRNIARFFGHLVATDAIPWTVFEIVKMNEDDTTSSSRIFIKILFQEMVEGLGLPELKVRFNDKTMQPYYQHMFPLDNPKNTRFSIKCVCAGSAQLTAQLLDVDQDGPADRGHARAPQERAADHAPAAPRPRGRHVLVLVVRQLIRRVQRLGRLARSQPASFAPASASLVDPAATSALAVHAAASS